MDSLRDGTTFTNQNQIDDLIINSVGFTGMSINNYMRVIVLISEYKSLYITEFGKIRKLKTVRTNICEYIDSHKNKLVSVFGYKSKSKLVLDLFFTYMTMFNR